MALPLQKNAADSTHTPPKHLNVLIIDDDRNDRLLYRQLFEKASPRCAFTLFEAENADAGFAMRAQSQRAPRQCTK